MEISSGTCATENSYFDQILVGGRFDAKNDSQGAVKLWENTGESVVEIEELEIQTILLATRKGSSGDESSDEIALPCSMPLLVTIEKIGDRQLQAIAANEGENPMSGLQSSGQTVSGVLTTKSKTNAVGNNSNNGLWRSQVLMDSERVVCSNLVLLSWGGQRFKTVFKCSGGGGGDSLMFKKGSVLALRVYKENSYGAGQTVASNVGIITLTKLKFKNNAKSV